MNIKLAETDEEIVRCFPVMCQLRKNLMAENFLSQVRRMQRERYQLAYLTDTSEVKTVGGFRVSDVQMFAAHRFYSHQQMDIVCHHFGMKL